MRLNERLKRAGAAADGERDLATRLSTQSSGVSHDPFAHIKNRAQAALFAKLGTRINDASITDEEIQMFVAEELARVIDEESAPLTPEERKQLASQVRDDLLGYGPIQMFLNDPTITEIMVNSQDPIYIERNGKIYETDVRFMSEAHLRRVIDRIVSQVGRRIDESSPMVDARLPDGSRVNAVIPPLSVDGPVLTIRLFSKDPYTANDLIQLGSLSERAMDLLKLGVEGRLNVIVSGGTGTGKTTLLNVLSSFIPAEQRIITIEDAVELQLQQRHTIRLESRPPNVEGRGQVTIRDLVRNALRMRPDRIIVGEARGGEALDMLQAMNTGHEGSLSTVHANSPRDAIARLETMVLMAGVELPDRAIREQIASAIDVIIHLTRLSDGTRKVTSVSEVVGMEGEVVTLQDVFAFDFSAGNDDDGRFLGSLRPTGIRPQFTDRLADYGIKVDPEIFGTPDDAVADLLRARR